MTETFDIVVVGSGAGGCAAALTAAGRKLSTLLIEKAPTLGGGTAASYGSMWIPNNPIAAGQGLEDSFEDAMAYAQFVAGGTALYENLKPMSARERGRSRVSRASAQNSNSQSGCRRSFTRMRRAAS